MARQILRQTTAIPALLLSPPRHRQPNPAPTSLLTFNNPRMANRGRTPRITLNNIIPREQQEHRHRHPRTTRAKRSRAGWAAVGPRLRRPLVWAWVSRASGRSSRSIRPTCLPRHRHRLQTRGTAHREWKGITGLLLSEYRCWSSWEWGKGCALHFTVRLRCLGPVRLGSVVCSVGKRGRLFVGHGFRWWCVG
jgi:hypothetical protein